MTQEEIKQHLHRLRYAGGWSITKLSKQVGLSPATIVAAMTTHISERSQARFSVALLMVPEKAPPVPERICKHKPGHLKRYLIRYYNLTGWLEVIEQEKGIRKKFVRKKQGNMSRDRAAFTCCRLDYQMKRYLMDLFEEKLKVRKVVMADCYPAEKWIERIHKIFPADRIALFKKIMKRGK